MTFFFLIPEWFILMLILLCVFGASAFAAKVILFITDHALLILAVMALLFFLCLRKIKTKVGRQKCIAAGIGMSPVLVYMWHTLPYLAKEALSGSLIRLIMDVLNWVFMIVLFTIAGLGVSVLYLERTDEKAGVSAIKYTTICSACAICFYLFVICG